MSPSAASSPTVWQIIQTQVQNFLTYGLPTPDNNYAGLYPGMYNALRQTLQAYFGVGIGNSGWSIAQQLTFGPGGTTAGAGGAWYPTPEFAALGADTWHWHPMASFASSSKVGGLSVPASWGTTPGAVEQASTKLVSTNFTTSPGEANPANGLNAALRGFPVGSRGAQRTGNLGVRYGFRYPVLTRPPSAG